MCGIAGIWGPGADPEDIRQRMRVALDRISHRGPDDEGMFEAGPLTLGHRRLVVIDRVGGTQPFSDTGGRVVCTFNGEIYNHRDLRRELEAAGEVFTTRSDTEVLVRSFACWGTDAFSRLDGMFAAALWRPEDQTLTLARDPAGEKPLFYREGLLAPGVEGFAFSSEVFSLLALLPGTPRVNPVGLWSYLTLGYARDPRLLDGIRQVPPAHWLTVRDGRVVEERRYWRPAPATLNLPEQEAIPFIRRAVKLAVVTRLEADVPLGAFLSGGVDSSIIVHEMRQAGVDSLDTFAIGFREGTGYDESPWAREVARIYNTRHHEQMFRVSEDILESTLDALDEPMADSSAIALWVLAKYARQHITVALGGDGGDEVFCGYERFAGVELTERLPLAVRKLLRPLAPLIPDTGGYGNRGDRLRRLLRDGVYPPEERLLRWQALCPPESSRQMLKDRSGLPPEFSWPLYQSGPEVSRLHGLLVANFESYLPDDLLAKTDRMTMSHGLELRSPFLARELVEAGFSLPGDGLMNRMRLKYWLRNAYRGALPDSILARRKHGFGVPLHVWFRGRLQEWAAARILYAHSPIYDHLDRDAVKLLWQGHLAKEFDAAQQLWGLVVLDHFLRRIRQ